MILDRKDLLVFVRVTKRIRSQATVSMVSLMGRSFMENGITGITARLVKMPRMWRSKKVESRTSIYPLASVVSESSL